MSISAIDAAVQNKKATLLLGLYADAGQASFDVELGLLSNAIDKYQSSFTDLIYAVSVGSEDFYRLSLGDSTMGKGDTVANIQHYICQTRQLLAAKGLAKIPVGHVDTWEMWGDTDAGQKILSNIDFVGMDYYPYFEYTVQSEAQMNFSTAYTDISTKVKNLPVWITETGWPVSAAANASDPAQPGLQEASNYWQSVGCGTLFGKVNTWWYILSDASEHGAGPAFGVAQSPTDKCGLYDLTCAADPLAQENSTSLNAAAGSCKFSDKRSDKKSSEAVSVGVTGAASVLGLLAFVCGFFF